MPRKWNRNGYAGKVHWSFNSEFLCSWKHCERGQTYLQRKHGSNSEGLAADRVLLPSLYGENLYTHRSLSDENPEK
ncbi:hypothetical protein TNCT_316001 [Trichonephila clavata]|nr:hypothetical protein TNCT_316001 [Trichonephila clavata]